MNRRIFGVIIICLLLAGILSADEVKKQKNGLYFGVMHQEAVDYSSIERIIINSASSISGNLHIIASDKDPEIKYQKRMKTQDKSEAESYAELIVVDIETQKTDLIIWLRAPGNAPWSRTNNSATLGVTILVPENNKVEVNSAYFEIDAIGPFSEFKITESLSKVTLDNVSGSVDVTVSNRPLILKNITGSLNATNKYEKIKLENIDIGDLTAVIRNENGEIYIDGFRGSLDARNSYGPFTARHVFLLGEGNKIKNISAPILLTLDSLTTGRLRVNNNYGPITLSIEGPADASFICRFGEESSVSAENLLMEPTLVFNDRLEFTTGESKAEVRLSAKGDGNIMIYGPDSN